MSAAACRGTPRHSAPAIALGMVRWLNSTMTADDPITLSTFVSLARHGSVPTLGALHG